MTFAEFEQRVARTPDLELSWAYWNVLLPDTTGRALWLLWVLPFLPALTPTEEG